MFNVLNNSGRKNILKMSDHFTLRFRCFILLRHCKAEGNRGKHLVMSNPSLHLAVLRENPHLTTLCVGTHLPFTHLACHHQVQELLASVMSIFSCIFKEVNFGDRAFNSEIRKCNFVLPPLECMPQNAGLLSEGRRIIMTLSVFSIQKKKKKVIPYLNMNNLGTF